MKYYVTVGGRTMEVDVMGERVRLDGVEIEAQLVSIPRTPLRRLVLGSVAHTLALLPAKSGWVVESWSRAKTLSCRASSALKGFS